MPGSGDWVRNTTYCFGEDDTCSSVSINIQPAATLESPGVVRTTYDNPLYMDMEERYEMKLIIRSSALPHQVPQNETLKPGGHTQGKTDLY